jgi:hypothetical protein
MFPKAKVLVKNNDGSPKHPLYVGYETTPTAYNC